MFKYRSTAQHLQGVLPHLTFRADFDGGLLLLVGPEAIGKLTLLNDDGDLQVEYARSCPPQIAALLLKVLIQIRPTVLVKESTAEFAVPVSCH